MQKMLFNSPEPELMIKAADMNEVHALLRELPDGVMLSISVEEDGLPS